MPTMCVAPICLDDNVDDAGKADDNSDNSDNGEKKEKNKKRACGGWALRNDKRAQCVKTDCR